MVMYDTIIIGSGCAGYAAAMYACRLAMKTLIIGEIDGGEIIWADSVENYPGILKISGEELSRRLKEHAMHYKPDFVSGLVKSIKRSGSCFKVFVKGKSYWSKTIILATGTSRNSLNIPGEKEFKARGIYSCAICDGPLYPGKTVAVIGGSDSAAKEALILSRYAKKVYIIYRGKEIRAEPINIANIRKNKKIEIINDTNLVKINGAKFVASVTLDKPYKGKKELKLDAIFVAVGHSPRSELARSLGVKLNEKSEVIIDRESKTNIHGFFAAGDVVNTKFKQAITGVAEAVSAAYSAHYHITQSEIFSCD